MKGRTKEAVSGSRKGKKPSLYGRFPLPVELQSDSVRVAAMPEGEVVHYRREAPCGVVEKTVVTSGGRLIVNPVEPVNLPQSISTTLLLHFVRPVVVEPKGRVVLFLTFPIEVGVFIARQQAVEMLDVFCLLPSKFTLYGPQGGGRVCKYWRSKVSFVPPTVKPLEEGVLALTVTNATPRWVEVNRAVFHAHGMKLFFGSALVAMQAEMRITAADMAETQFVDRPLHEGMKKSLEVYRARKLSTAMTRFMMEYGL
ncbi:MAG: DUF432 domain-containing protein [candidate division KSB1 bacterium]|nr:DUF432 domain-containing protein [candidate division KSB1 bacterium]